MSKDYREFRHELIDMINQLRLAEKQHHRWAADFHCELLCNIHKPGFVESIGQEHECEFGKWYDEAIQYFQLQGDAIFVEIGEFHANFHTIAQQLHNMAESGQSIEQRVYQNFSRSIEKFHEKIAELEFHLWTSICLIDPLTGLRNRQGMLIELHDEQTRTFRTHDHCTIAMGDIDNFKSFNDTYGHTVGDEILKAIATIMSEEMRIYDRLYRYGGEEFLFCFPHTDAAEAKNILERVRQRIANRRIEIDKLKPLNLTMSFGLTMLDLTPIEDNIKRADDALLVAKQAGKNQVAEI